VTVDEARDAIAAPADFVNAGEEDEDVAGVLGASRQLRFEI
jgi:hypothetical protein